MLQARGVNMHAFKFTSDESTLEKPLYCGLRFQITLVYTLMYEPLDSWERVRFGDEFPFVRQRYMTDIVHAPRKTGSETLLAIEKAIRLKKTETHRICRWCRRRRRGKRRVPKDPPIAANSGASLRQATTCVSPPMKSCGQSAVLHWVLGTIICGPACKRSVSEVPNLEAWPCSRNVRSNILDYFRGHLTKSCTNDVHVLRSVWNGCCPGRQHLNSFVWSACGFELAVLKQPTRVWKPSLLAWIALFDISITSCWKSMFLFHQTMEHDYDLASNHSKHWSRELARSFCRLGWTTPFASW